MQKVTVLSGTVTFLFIFEFAIDKSSSFWYNISVVLNVPLAQAAEHLPFKQGVPGSIPGWHTRRDGATESVWQLSAIRIFSASQPGVFKNLKRSAQTAGDGPRRNRGAVYCSAVFFCLAAVSFKKSKAFGRDSGRRPAPKPWGSLLLCGIFLPRSR